MGRKEAFEKKRAERLEAKGVRIDNIDSATVGLHGYDQEGSRCEFCDHPIKWLYVLHLTLTNGERVTFDPVGSSCIESWVNALPVSEAHAELIAALNLAVAESDKIKAVFTKIANKVKDGTLQDFQGRALRSFFASPPCIRNERFLKDVATKASGRGFTERQWSSWSDSLWAAQRTLEAPDCPHCCEPTRYRNGKFGAFYGCSAYPACKWTANEGVVMEMIATAKAKAKETQEHEAAGTVPASQSFQKTYDDLPY